MKQFTQEEFNNFEIIDGRRQCPTGDYSLIKSFGECCSFGERCSFESLKFDKIKQPYFIRINNIGSRCDGCCIYNSDSGIYVRSGCYFGSEAYFLQRVKETHKGNQFERQYILAVELAKATFSGGI
jgi:hypothetical protein